MKKKATKAVKTKPAAVRAPAKAAKKAPTPRKAIPPVKRAKPSKTVKAVKPPKAVKAVKTSKPAKVLPTPVADAVQQPKKLKLSKDAATKFKKLLLDLRDHLIDGVNFLPVTT
jgi:hypothetical protein